MVIAMHPENRLRRPDELDHLPEDQMPFANDLKIAPPLSEHTQPVDRTCNVIQVDQHIRRLGPVAMASQVRVFSPEAQCPGESLEQKVHAMEVALGSMAQGICTFDARGRIALYNNAFQDLLDLPQSLIDKRPTNQEILDFQNHRGDLGRNFELIETAARAGIARTINGGQMHPPSHLRRTSGGAVLEIKIKDLASAGKLMSVLDVTSSHLLLEVPGEDGSGGRGKTGPLSERQDDRGRRALAIWTERQLPRQDGTDWVIAERQGTSDERERATFYDTLTGLPNRLLLLERLAQALKATTDSQQKGILLFIDLEKLGRLNETLGHHIGDLLIQQVAQRLQSCVRQGDMVARLAGDEFVVLLENVGETQQPSAAHAENVGRKLQARLNQTYQLGPYQHNNTPCIGFVVFGDPTENAEDLLTCAEFAMSRNKESRRNANPFPGHDRRGASAQDATLETELRQALEQEQFCLHYQPQVDVSGCLLGAEVLVRWLHPTQGLILPDQFITLAERTGLILGIGHQVLRAACGQLALWSADSGTKDLTLSVNISARQIQQADFVEQVLSALECSGANPSRLKLELTESMLLHDVEDTIDKMTQLKRRGVEFSLDDFGTGYSSLSYLKRLPLDELKIDRSFVRDVTTDIRDAAIARAILSLGQTMGLTVIAEGVETAEQRGFLLRLGCTAYQGYLFGRPGPVEDLPMLRN